jgi:hypothetical protein
MALPLIPLALRYGVKKFGPKALKALNIGANVSYGIDTAKQIKEGKTDNLEALSTVSALKVKAPILKFYDIVTRDKKFGTSAKTKSYILRKKKVDDIKDQRNEYAVRATGRSATGGVRNYKSTQTRSQIRDKQVQVAKVDENTGEIFGDPTKLYKESRAKTKSKFSKKKESIGKDVTRNRVATKTKGDTAREIEQMRSTIAARLDDRKAKGDMKGTVVLSDKDGLVRKIYSQEAKKRGISLRFANVPKVTKGDLSGPPSALLGKEFSTVKKITGDKKFATETDKLRTMGQQSAVLRYIKKGRIAKQDTAILGFHEKRKSEFLQSNEVYDKNKNFLYTTNTRKVLTDKGKFKEVSDEVTYTPRNIIGSTYRNLKKKGYSAKLIRDELRTKLSGRQ